MGAFKDGPGGAVARATLIEIIVVMVSGLPGDYSVLVRRDEEPGDKFRLPAAPFDSDKLVEDAALDMVTGAGYKLANVPRLAALRDSIEDPHTRRLRFVYCSYVMRTPPGVPPGASWMRVRDAGAYNMADGHDRIIANALAAAELWEHFLPSREMLPLINDGGGGA